MTATVSGGPCRICGRELPPEHPMSDFVGWPPMFDPCVFTIANGWSNPLPTRDEMCSPCQRKLGIEAGQQ